MTRTYTQLLMKYFTLRMFCTRQIDNKAVQLLLQEEVNSLFDLVGCPFYDDFMKYSYFSELTYHSVALIQFIFEPNAVLYKTLYSVLEHPSYRIRCRINKTA